MSDTDLSIKLNLKLNPSDGTAIEREMATIAGSIDDIFTRVFDTFDKRVAALGRAAGKIKAGEDEGGAGGGSGAAAAGGGTARISSRGDPGYNINTLIGQQRFATLLAQTMAKAHGGGGAGAGSGGGGSSTSNAGSSGASGGAGGALSSLIKQVTQLATLGSGIAGVQMSLTGLVNAVSAATSAALEHTIALGELQRATSNTSQSLTDFRSSILATGNQLGYAYQAIIAATQAYTATGSTSAQPAALPATMRNVEQFASGEGQDLGQLTSQLASLTMQGYGGGAGGEQRLASSLANAMQAGGMQGRFSEMVDALQSLTGTIESRTSQTPDAATLFGIMSTANASGIRGLQGTRGAAVLGSVDQTIANMGAGTPGSQMLMYSALSKGGTLSYPQTMFRAASGIGGPGNLQDVIQTLNKVYPRGGAMGNLGDQSFATLGAQQALGLASPLQAQAFLQAFDPGGRFTAGKYQQVSGYAQRQGIDLTNPAISASGYQILAMEGGGDSMSQVASYARAQGYKLPKGTLTQAQINAAIQGQPNPQGAVEQARVATTAPAKGAEDVAQALIGPIETLRDNFGKIAHGAADVLAGVTDTSKAITKINDYLNSLPIPLGIPTPPPNTTPVIGGIENALGGIGGAIGNTMSQNPWLYATLPFLSTGAKIGGKVVGGAAKLASKVAGAGRDKGKGKATASGDDTTAAETASAAGDTGLSSADSMSARVASGMSQAGTTAAQVKAAGDAAVAAAEAEAVRDGTTLPSSNAAAVRTAAENAARAALRAPSTADPAGQGSLLARLNASGATKPVEEPIKPGESPGAAGIVMGGVGAGVLGYRLLSKVDPKDFPPIPAAADNLTASQWQTIIGTTVQKNLPKVPHSAADTLPPSSPTTTDPFLGNTGGVTSSFGMDLSNIKSRVDHLVSQVATSDPGYNINTQQGQQHLAAAIVSAQQGASPRATVAGGALAGLPVQQFMTNAGTTAATGNAAPPVPGGGKVTGANSGVTGMPDVGQGASSGYGQIVNGAINSSGVATGAARSLGALAPLTASAHGTITQGFGGNFGLEPGGWTYADGSETYGTPTSGNTGGGTFSPHLLTGLDVSEPYGTPLYSQFGGKVVKAQTVSSGNGIDPADNYGYGMNLTIQSANGQLQEMMAHLSAINVKVGQTVQAGQQVGNVGLTGNTTGPHVDLSLMRTSDSHFIDPSNLLNLNGPFAPTSQPTAGADAAGVPSFVPAQYRSLVAASAKASGIPASIIAAQIMRESGWNPTIKAGDYATTGSTGLGQFTNDTAASLGITNKNDPQQAIMGVGTLDKDNMTALRQLGLASTQNMLAAYQAGVSNVSAAGGVPGYDTSYVRDILRLARTAPLPAPVVAPTAQATAAVKLTHEYKPLTVHIVDDKGRRTTASTKVKPKPRYAGSTVLPGVPLK